MLQEVSRRSGVPIIASSGLYFTEEPFLSNKPAEQLAELFIGECRDGIEGTSALPGILKCATDAPGFTSANTTLLRMTALVHKATGLPIFAHSSAHHRTGIGQLRILEEHGVDPGRVIIGHCADTTDLDYLETLLNRGCYIGLDRYRFLLQRVDMITELIRRGWINQLILSHDYCAFLDFGQNSWTHTKEVYAARAESGYTYIHRLVVPALLQQGVTEQQLRHIFVDNPRRFWEG
jgi:phosphotriesterase-related protein